MGFKAGVFLTPLILIAMILVQSLIGASINVVSGEVVGERIDLGWGASLEVYGRIFIYTPPKPLYIYSLDGVRIAVREDLIPLFGKTWPDGRIWYLIGELLKARGGVGDAGYGISELWSVGNEVASFLGKHGIKQYGFIPSCYNNWWPEEQWPPPEQELFVYYCYGGGLDRRFQGLEVLVHRSALDAVRKIIHEAPGFPNSPWGLGFLILRAVDLRQPEGLRPPSIGLLKKASQPIMDHTKEVLREIEAELGLGAQWNRPDVNFCSIGWGVTGVGSIFDIWLCYKNIDSYEEYRAVREWLIEIGKTAAEKLAKRLLTIGYVRDEAKRFVEEDGELGIDLILVPLPKPITPTIIVTYKPTQNSKPAPTEDTITTTQATTSTNHTIAQNRDKRPEASQASTLHPFLAILTAAISILATASILITAKLLRRKNQ